MKELKQVIRQAVSRWIERRKAKGDNETMEKTEVSTPETNGTACCPTFTVSTDKQQEIKRTEKQYLQYVLELLRIFFLEYTVADNTITQENFRIPCKSADKNILSIIQPIFQQGYFLPAYIYLTLKFRKYINTVLIIKIRLQTLDGIHRKHKLSVDPEKTRRIQFVFQLAQRFINNQMFPLKCTCIG